MRTSKLRMATLRSTYLLRSKPYKKWLLQAKPQRDLNPTTRCWHSWLRSNKIKCGVNPPQINSQSTFIQLTPHFTVLGISLHVFEQNLLTAAVGEVRCPAVVVAGD